MSGAGLRAHWRLNRSSLASASEAKIAERANIDKYLPGAGDVSAEERSRIFRLGWDFTSSALANRIELYERFYLASGPRNLQNAHIRADRSEGARMVNRFLAEPFE